MSLLSNPGMERENRIDFLALPPRTPGGQQTMCRPLKAVFFRTSHARPSRKSYTKGAIVRDMRTAQTTLGPEAQEMKDALRIPAPVEITPVSGSQKNNHLGD